MKTVWRKQINEYIDKKVRITGVDSAGDPSSVPSTYIRRLTTCNFSSRGSECMHA